VAPVVMVMASIGVTLMLQGLIRLFGGVEARHFFFAERKDIFRLELPFEAASRKIVITEPPGPRIPVTLERWGRNDIPKDAIMEQNWKNALDKALSICSMEDLLCVAGSLYLVGAVREELMKRDFCVYNHNPRQDRTHKR